MSERIELSWFQVYQRAELIARKIDQDRLDLSPPILYGVPNGGVYAAMAVASASKRCCFLTESADGATHVIDDIIDSGRTRDWHAASHRHARFLALVDKQGADRAWLGKWVVFPWERMRGERGAEDAVRRLIQCAGDDPDREGLKETPARVIKSYAELFAGYKQDPADILKTFEQPYDEMIVLRNASFSSTCEHHMLPFYGTAHVAYVPSGGRVVGLSKLARLVDCFARRLQMQERITHQVTEALDEILLPLGSACVITATHLCLCGRGAGKTGADMVTSSLTGCFREGSARAEFLSLVGK